MTATSSTHAEAAGLFDRLLPERLFRLQRSSGVPIVFGGPVRVASGNSQLVIERTFGTLGHGLRGLQVCAGKGLGGAVVRDSAARRVGDYASTQSISHDYDTIVLREERLHAVVAVPVVVQAKLIGVLYGATREPLAIGDRALATALVVARNLSRDVSRRADEVAHAKDSPREAALNDLAELIQAMDDPQLRRRLVDIQTGLTAAVDTPGPHPGPGVTQQLAPRELEVLRLISRGCSTIEIAAELGLGYETVRAYVRSTLRKLNVKSRLAAVDMARRAGRLDTI